MGLAGNLIGGGLGHIAGNYFGGSKGAEAGQQIGSVLGGFLPFKKGGKVPGAKGKPVKAILHGGEFVLPSNVKPTMAQKKAVAKLHKKGKKM
jgi:hypothetical protein